MRMGSGERVDWNYFLERRVTVFREPRQVPPTDEQLGAALSREAGRRA